jgi:hypothetical protein
MSNLENVIPELTARDDEVGPIVEATQYNVYCWAKDSAMDSRGSLRQQYMSQAYASSAVAVSGTPLGGTTTHVWVIDATPPEIILIGSESTNDETIQLVLQLNEPGTIWCAATELDSSSVATRCKNGDMQEANTASGNCYFETFIKGGGTDATVFRTDAHLPYVDVTVEMNKIWDKDEAGSAELEHETEYQIFCFAEDDWHIEAAQAAALSISFSAPTGPNKVSFSTVGDFKDLIGLQKTLDDTPPSFTKLAMQDPTAADSQIVVTFALNEDGTAYCRAARSDSGETAADMPIARIMTANWVGVYNSSDAPEATISISALENVDPALTIRDDEVAPIMQSTQYDVYCWAQDSAVDSHGVARQQYMTQAYVNANAGSPTAPVGGSTPFVWVLDSTPPTMIFVDAESTNHETIQLTLQLNEPGTLWCAAVELDSSSGTTNCKNGEIQDATTGSGTCYFETYIRGSPSDQTVFRSLVHEAYTDVSIDVNRIWEKDQSGSAALEHETSYNIFCHAEDDWHIQAYFQSPSLSINFSPMNFPNKVALTQVTTLVTAIGDQTTLDDTPSFLHKVGDSGSNGSQLTNRRDVFVERGRYRILSSDEV